jgi:AraC-like DNA-binding protein
MGSVMLARTRSKAQTWNRTARNIANDGMDHYMIQRFNKGSTWFDGKHTQHVVGEEGLIVFDLSRPSQSFTSDYENFSLIVPRHMLEDHLYAPDDQHLRILDTRQPLAAMLHDQLASLDRNIAGLGLSEAVDIEPAVLGLAASSLNSADGKGRQTSRPHPILALSEIKKYIQTHLSSPDLTTASIAREMGLSRSRLYQLFDSYGGVSSFIRQQRLRKALIILSGQQHRQRSVYDIALECGYSSDTAFIRAFRDQYDLTPGDIRSGLTVQTRRAGSGDQGLDKRYEQWLNQLN